MQQNNNLTELFAIILAALLAIIGAVLLYLGKIDYNGALALWGIAAGAFGFNLVYKAPSPIQQARTDAQQQNVQQLLSQALAVLPVFASLLHSHTPAPQAPVVPPQPVQTAVLVQPAMQSSQPVTPVSVPTTTLQPQAPPVVPQRDDFSQSALMRAVGQFPPQQQQ